MAKISEIKVNQPEDSIALDKEWIELMKLARQMGFSPEEVRLFFKNFSNESAVYNNQLKI